MSRMYPDTVTIWMRMPEDADKRAQWRRKVLEGVRFEGSRSLRAGANGDLAQDTFLCIVPNAFAQYIPANRLTKERDLAPNEWTLRKDDYVLEDEHLDDAPHPNALRINAVAPLKRGSSAVHHWEVSG